MKKFTTVIIDGMDFNLGLTRTACSNLPSIATSNNDEREFVLNNLKMFLEDANFIDLDDIKSNEFFMVNTGLYAAEVVINEDIYITRFVALEKAISYAYRRKMKCFNVGYANLAFA